MYDQDQRTDFRYSINVPDEGLYNVRLHYAEIREGINAVGERMFNVRAERQKLFEALDIYAQASVQNGQAKNSAFVKEFLVFVDDGKLTLDFDGIQGRDLPRYRVSRS